MPNWSTTCSPAARRLTILATSREPLMVAGEVNWQVPSLSLADEAVELFTDRARRARPDFAVTEANSETVTEICRRLDGMPLAIELAAARVRALSLDEIVGSLHDRSACSPAALAPRCAASRPCAPRWTGHTPCSPNPSESCSAAWRYSWAASTSTPPKPSPATTEVERFQVLDQLSLLVDKSLVVAENAGGRTRYRLLETVRQYALEKLGESGEADDVRTRHRDHFWSMAARLDAPATSGHQQRISQALQEMDNLRAAFTWSRENGETSKELEFATFLQSVWLVARPHSRRPGVARHRSRRRCEGDLVPGCGPRQSARRQGIARFLVWLIGHPGRGASRSRVGDRPGKRRPGAADSRAGGEGLRRSVRTRRRAVFRRGGSAGARPGRLVAAEPDPRAAVVPGAVRDGRPARRPVGERGTRPCATHRGSIDGASMRDIHRGGAHHDG